MAVRTIIFRGKRIDNGEWLVSGTLLQNSDDERFCWMPVYGDKFGTAEDDNGNILRMEYGTLYRVDPETVNQYTGLKDKNGKRIFEGDIVVCSQEINGNFIDKHVAIGFVEMRHGAFGLHRKQGYYRPFKDWLEDYELEVIGNIHDNGELMEVR